jgi:hypothetical protein
LSIVEITVNRYPKPRACGSRWTTSVRAPTCTTPRVLRPVGDTTFANLQVSCRRIGRVARKMLVAVVALTPVCPKDVPMVSACLDRRASAAALPNSPVRPSFLERAGHTHVSHTPWLHGTTLEALVVNIHTAR